MSQWTVSPEPIPDPPTLLAPPEHEVRARSGGRVSRESTRSRTARSAPPPAPAEEVDRIAAIVAWGVAWVWQPQRTRAAWERWRQEGWSAQYDPAAWPASARDMVAAWAPDHTRAFLHAWPLWLWTVRQGLDACSGQRLALPYLQPTPWWIVHSWSRSRSLTDQVRWVAARWPDCPQDWPEATVPPRIQQPWPESRTFSETFQRWAVTVPGMAGVAVRQWIADHQWRGMLSETAGDPFARDRARALIVQWACADAL